MIVHPPRALRPYSVAAIGFSAFFAAACAAGIGGSALSSDSVGPVRVAALLLGEVALLGLAGLLAGLAVVIHRGPPAPATGDIRVSSSDPLAIWACCVTGSALLGGSLTMIDHWLAGAARAPDLMIWTIASVLGLLGGLLLGGGVLLLGNRWLRGLTYLDLEHLPVSLGETLRGRLEVPFAAARELELCIDLQLRRADPGPDPDAPPEEIVVWRTRALAIASEPAGPRRSIARFAIPLECPAPGDPDAFPIPCTWHMEVTPSTGSVWWNAVFEPPIELKPSSPPAR